MQNNGARKTHHRQRGEIMRGMFIRFVGRERVGCQSRDERTIIPILLLRFRQVDFHIVEIILRVFENELAVFVAESTPLFAGNSRP